MPVKDITIQEKKSEALVETGGYVHPNSLWERRTTAPLLSFTCFNTTV